VGFQESRTLLFFVLEQDLAIFHFLDSFAAASQSLTLFSRIPRFGTKMLLFHLLYVVVLEQE
jgi:hypothetical protein